MKKLKILGIHVGNKKTFKKGMIFKNFIFFYIQNFMKKEIYLSPKNISEKDSQSVQKNNTFCEKHIAKPLGKQIFFTDSIISSS